MDVGALAKDVVAFLAPFLPYLVKGAKLAGQEAAKKLGEQFSEESVAAAKSLWERLRPKAEARPAAQEAVEEVAAAPQDADAQAALRLQVRQILSEDEALTAEVARVMASAVIQRVLAQRRAIIKDVEQRAKGGPTEQEVKGEGKGTRIKGVRQIRE
nr:hypothetical protein [Chloroflexota bacterium]